MTKWILVLLSATALWAATPDPKAEKEVVAAMDAYKQALLKRDDAALAKILSDDLTYTHSSNQHQDKAAVLQSLKGNSYQVSIVFKDMKVRVYGGSAVVTTDADFTSNTGGLSPLHLTVVWVKGKDGWQMVARQATKYADAAAKK